MGSQGMACCETLRCPVQVMRETLAFLCMTHGSIATYLQACGFDVAAQAQLASDLAPSKDASAPQG